jgi:hypothetical protein
MSEGKFCKDCRWVGPPTASTDTRFCQHPVSGFYGWVDVVSGEQKTEQVTCRFNRALGDCGPDAVHWEPGDTPVGFV